MRISDQTLFASMLTDLDWSRQALVKSQQVLASGREVQRPSDDPARAMDAMSARSGLAENSQYQRNVTSGMNWLQATDGALTQVNTLVQRARQLVVQATNSTTGGADAAAIAQELAQTTDAIIGVGNSALEGRYIFAGARTTTAPLSGTGSPATAVTYNGDSTDVVREVAAGSTEAVNVRGDQVFTGAKGILPALIQATTDVQSGNTGALAADLQNLDTALDNLTTVRTDVGARVNRMQTASQDLSSLESVLTQQLSTSEDADMAQAATRYAMLDTAYKAALSAAGRLLPTSLIDFLR